MSIGTMRVNAALRKIQCSCGGVYAITKAHYDHQQEVGGTWTCPYCRTSWGFSGKGDNATLKRKLEASQRAKASAEGRASRARDEADYQYRRAATFKGQVTKIKNRIAKGVCPCCNRTFANLARHMESQHPGFTES